MTVIGRKDFAYVTAAFFLALPGCATVPVGAPAVDVAPSGETVAVGTANADAADDPAIWAAPAGTDAMLGGQAVRGFIAGTDKKAGLYVYGLDGAQLQFIRDGLLNNVDLREGVTVDGREQVLIGASDRGRMGIALYLFDPASRDPANQLRPWGFIRSDVTEPYGFCLGMSGGAPHAFLIGKDGETRQYRIETGPSGPTGTEVRRFAIGSQSEGCVVDDSAGRLYVGEENGGVWRYALDAGSGSERIQLQAIDDSGRLVPDVEGVTLIRDGGATYLIVSSQGDSAFALWRVDGAEPAYVGRFRVGAGDGIDAVTGTDGLDARGGPVGDYPEGLVVVQDDENEGAQNFKLIDWRAIKAALGL
ncbi:phytase [Sphingosinicella sp. CPCC 101087]|uniref:phytase n=1 Tax=Sphingosinicella sp. CPCC 101087 TaxID=2497754 RepID=UPI00101C9CD8